MSITLRKRKNLDGTESLLLDIYHNGSRRCEFLKELKLANASNPDDRQANKEKMHLAKKLVLQRALELTASDHNTTTNVGKKTEVVGWMQSFIDTYRKKDKRNLQGALNRFVGFLAEDKKTGLTFGRLTELIYIRFSGLFA